MFENIVRFFKSLKKSEEKEEKTCSKDKAKERLHLVLMQDRANVSADFLEMMKQEIIEVIKKYIEVDEKEIDVRLTNEIKEDGTTGAPALYANIPIVNIRNEMKKETIKEQNDIEDEETEQNLKESKKEENNNNDVSDTEKEVKTETENKENNIITKENIEIINKEETKKEVTEETGTDKKEG